MSEPASVMCVLCKSTGTVETDVDEAAGIASAMAWAVHFAQVHPQAPGGVSRYLVMTHQPTGTVWEAGGRSHDLP